MEYQQLIEQRYSVRKFDSTPLSEDDIRAVLEAGRIAPTAINAQPQRIWVATKPEDLKKVDSCSPCRFNAPAVLVVGYVNSAAQHKDEYGGSWSYGLVDSSIVFTHMMLKAHDLGLGTCWVGMFDSKKIHKVFNIPDDVTIMGLMPFGHPSPKAKPAPLHGKRKRLQETVTWL